MIAVKNHLNGSDIHFFDKAFHSHMKHANRKVWLTIAYLKGMYKVLLVSRGSLYQYPTLCCEIVNKSKDEILSMKWIKSSGGCSTNSTIKSTTRQNRSCEYCEKLLVKSPSRISCDQMLELPLKMNLMLMIPHYVWFHCHLIQYLAAINYFHW